MKNLTKTANEIFFEDESIISEINKGLNDDEQLFFVRIIETCLEILTYNQNLTDEEISEKIRSKNGISDKILKLKKLYTETILR